MPKILFITQDFPPPLEGGSVVYYYNILKYFNRDEVVVHTAWVKNHKNFDRQQPYKIIRSKGVYKSNNPILSGYWGILKMYSRWLITAFYLVFKEKIDILHVGKCLWIGAIALVIKKITGKKYVIYLHGEEITRFLRKTTFIAKYEKIVFLSALRYAGKLICNSKFTRSKLLNLNIPLSKIEVVNPGVDQNRFKPQKKSPELQKRYNLQGNKIILSIGRFEERKGQDMVIRSLPNVIKKFPEIKYLIAGRGPNEANLRKLTKEIEMEEYVIFTEFIHDDELTDYYNLCDLFVMPSRELKDGDTEGFGIVFLEANACGKPVIGGNVGGISEAVLHEKTGLIVDGEDPTQIANAIIKLLTDEKLAKKLGENGRKRVEKEFGWETKAAKIKEINKQL